MVFDDSKTYANHVNKVSQIRNFCSFILSTFSFVPRAHILLLKSVINDLSN